MDSRISIPNKDIYICSQLWALSVGQHGIFLGVKAVGSWKSPAMATQNQGLH
jgi:hypothetical protein